ncbi:MAG TPA: alpha/beta fold hydrolase, partial [Solirubrobacteraceae bacterium]|nr:alpha/beta fold hydrolase [Solirubrobacteraceae bacterium]
MPVTTATPGLVMTEHEFEVPLDHARPDGERITVFAREVTDPDGTDRPYLVFFQGGPGFEAPRPTRHPSSPGWLDRALRDFRVLMLDQRGTGRSSPVGALPGLGPQEQADRLAHFRADAIVHDAEWIRRELDVERWSILGQSFGGLCVTTYLSLAPEGLREALITGGVPALGPGAIDDVYDATYASVSRRRDDYFARYPEDRERLRDLARRIEDEELRLPSGDPLSLRRVLGAGAVLGMADGAERLHYL